MRSKRSTRRPASTISSTGFVSTRPIDVLPVVDGEGCRDHRPLVKSPRRVGGDSVKVQRNSFLHGGVGSMNRATMAGQGQGRIFALNVEGTTDPTATLRCGSKSRVHPTYKHPKCSRRELQRPDDQMTDLVRRGDSHPVGVTGGGRHLGARWTSSTRGGSVSSHSDQRPSKPH